MNEIGLIRRQLALERAHVTAVANACAGAVLRADIAPEEVLGPFRDACVDYLACVLAWFEERDQRLMDLLQARFAPTDPAQRTLEEVLARHGRSRDVLAKLEAACGQSGSDGRHGWREFEQHFNSLWSTRRDALEGLLAADSRPSDWRTFGGIDADSILEERKRYAQVSARLPPGVTLGVRPR
jgi:hypothetical protein